MFLKINEFHKMVVNVPTGERGEFVKNLSIKHLIGFENIIKTLPNTSSNRF